MRNSWRVAVIAAFLAQLPGWAFAAPRQPTVQVAAERFLTAYARGDRQAVLATLTRGPIRIYGGDVSEVATDRAGAARILDADQKLWRGGASFGPMTNVSSERAGRLASLFFDDTFHLGDRSVPVRFAMVWRLQGGAWRLVQSSNVSPTVGQSAAELLVQSGSEQDELAKSH